ncbi:MAG: hypothetical protein ABR907_12155 [Terracidiphilus sp.]|jgi:transposase
MDAALEKLYSDTGRPSNAPERLLHTTLLSEEHFTVDSTLIQA